MKDEQFNLPDGRRLGFAEYGASRGVPVFYFHGFPGSRLEASLLDETALDLNARIIGVDRPGYGYSDRRHGRRFIDWPSDVAALADFLKIGKFSIIGVSGGGPYALSAASHFADRVTATSIVCGLGPLSCGGGSSGMPTRRRFACRFLRLTPWLIPYVSGTIGRQLANDPEGVFTHLLKRVPTPDRETLTKPENRKLLQQSFTEAVRRGACGIASDALLYLSDWGFDLRTITRPVTFWHGEQDETVPARMSRDLSKTLSHSRLELLPQEGHYSLPFRYHREILASAIGG